ncbi:type IV secretory system conjugative DNA transfer family protein [Hartmannibacter diazotrophicus]|uniref:type IV secretory system conjugative DNA transfer family protein n=1 Tax=Hartmannibacter diazotrophicus TaxID=1482074 RepID=UPI0031841BB3
MRWCGLTTCGFSRPGGVPVASMQLASLSLPVDRIHARDLWEADATSKWFRSASRVRFAVINDPETANCISRRCGNTTVEVDQINRTSQMSESSRTRSEQFVRVQRR